MLTQSRIPICLSLLAYDWRTWTVIKTEATFYQKDRERFHLVLTEPLVQETGLGDTLESSLHLDFSQTPRLLWLEISRQRVTMTMQGNGKFSYRHLWEYGERGTTRYWLQNEYASNSCIQLRNQTHSLTLDGSPLPNHIRVEYDLWSAEMKLGRYVMNLEINHEFDR